MFRRGVSFLTLLVCLGCHRVGDDSLFIGVAFETLQTEGWVASFEEIRAELLRRDAVMVEAIANGDASRQFEQVNNFIARRLDGIIIAPKDAQSVVPMIRAANTAGIPVVLFNRPAAKSDARAIEVIVDNVEISRMTVLAMVEQARRLGLHCKAAIGLGDLSDLNAVGRREGFEAAVREHADIIEVVARVPTEWNSEKVLAGFTNAFQVHPEINFIFLSSDMMLPSLVSALKGAGKYKKIDEEGHVLLGAFDGDATAYRLMREGYLDVDGVQDLYFEARESVRAVLDMIAGKPVPDVIRDPGFVVRQDNLDELESRMWGAQVARAQRRK